MKLVIQIIITLVAIVSILWLYSDPGFDSLMASLTSLMAVAGIGISDQIHRQKNYKEDLEQKFSALREVKTVLDRALPNLDSSELLEKLKTDSDLCKNLTSSAVRLFGLRNELIPYIESDFVELIDSQLQPLYDIKLGTYTFKQEKVEQFVSLIQDLRKMVALNENKLRSEYEKRLK